VLNGDGKTAQSGYELDYNAAADGISLVLQRQGVEVAHGHLKAPADTGSDDPNAPPITLDIYRQGRFIYAGIGKQVAIQYADAHPVDGYALAQNLDYAPDTGGHSRLGLILRGSTAMDMPNIVVNNKHVYAETFHLAPVNWRPQSGEWTMFSRWACQPGWTWYGGRDAGYATNWHKNSMWGDQSIDYFAGAMMAAEKNAGTEAWRDLNCAFCSDGVNLFSGYTLIVDGNWSPSTSKLYRKGKVVAESNAFLFPPQGVAHRLWFDVHIAKQGNTIHVLVTYLDNQGQRQEYPLMDYTDPEPLDGGFVGFWTWDNGMMLSRTVLSCQQPGKQPVYTADPTWLATEPADAPYPGDKDAALAIHDLKPPAEAYISMPGASHTQPAAATHPVSKPVHEAAATVPTEPAHVPALGIR
nr:hypothetical protein [Armatimonadota bacterium]